MSEAKEIKLVQLNIKELDLLYKSYLKFVTGGGIYFFSDENFFIGDEVFLSLNIKINYLDKKYCMQTEVVWKNAYMGKKGYGVAFGKDSVAEEAKKDIEALLEPVIDLDKKTFTM